MVQVPLLTVSNLRYKPIRNGNIPLSRVWLEILPAPLKYIFFIYIFASVYLQKNRWRPSEVKRWSRNELFDRHFLSEYTHDFHIWGEFLIWLKNRCFPDRMLSLLYLGIIKKINQGAFSTHQEFPSTPDTWKILNLFWRILFTTISTITWTDIPTPSFITDILQNMGSNIKNVSTICDANFINQNVTQILLTQMLRKIFNKFDWHSTA